MDPMSEVNMKLDKIMEKLGIQVDEKNFEQMTPDGQNRQMEQEFEKKAPNLMGAGPRG